MDKELIDEILRDIGLEHIEDDEEDRQTDRQTDRIKNRSRKIALNGFLLSVNYFSVRI